MEPSSGEGPSVTVATLHPPKEVEGRVMFFKGGNEKRLKACIDANGDIKLARIRTSPPSDFHPTSPTLLYLTKDHHVANMYAGFAERRFNSRKGAVMHIAVPHDLVSAPVEVFGEDWQDLI
jgi:hypothetical protein